MLLIDSQADPNFGRIKDVWAEASKVIVLSGAGISTACGIKDFRSDDGLYKMTVKDLLQTLNNAVCNRTNIKGDVVFEKLVEEDLFHNISPDFLKRPSTDLFEYSVFQSAGLAIGFYRFIALLKEYITQNVAHVSQMHLLVNQLRRQGRLARWMTQNIDGLEAKSGCRIYTGLTEDATSTARQEITFDPSSFEVVQMHGGLETAWCTKCSSVKEMDHEVAYAFLAGECHDCPHCLNTRKVRSPGFLRPGMVLYKESHVSYDIIQDFISSVVRHDLKHGADLLLIVGTSLKIRGAITLVQDIAQRMKHKRSGKKTSECVVMVGHEVPTGGVENSIDIFVKMDCEDFANALWSVEPCAARPPKKKSAGDKRAEDEASVMSLLLG